MCALARGLECIPDVAPFYRVKCGPASDSDPMSRNGVESTGAVIACQCGWFGYCRSLRWRSIASRPSTIHLLRDTNHCCNPKTFNHNTTKKKSRRGIRLIGNNFHEQTFFFCSLSSETIV